MKSKSLIIIVIFLGLSTITNAQETIKILGVDLPASDGTGDIYYKDTNNYLNKYIGEWLYDEGTNYLKVTFIKKERVRIGTTNTYLDKLACEYLFKINGVVIYDTYGTNSNIDDSIANYIIGSRIFNFDVNKIHLFYSEPPINGCERYASGELTLVYVANPNPELIWTRINDLLYGDSTECSDGSPMDTSDFVIPANMVLTKVN